VVSTFTVNEWIQHYIGYHISKNPLYTTALLINELMDSLGVKYKGKLLKFSNHKGYVSSGYLFIRKNKFADLTNKCRIISSKISTIVSLRYRR
jgi:hypothetical protein